MTYAVPACWRSVTAVSTYMWEYFVRDPSLTDPAAPWCDTTRTAVSGGITNALPTHAKVVFPAGTYTLASGATFYVFGGSDITLDGSAKRAVLQEQDLGSAPASAAIEVIHANRVLIQGFTIHGNNPGGGNHTGTWINERGHGIRVGEGSPRDTANVRVTNNDISQVWGDGVNVDCASLVMVDNNTVTGAGRHGLGVQNADNVTFDGNSLYSVGAAGIDVEPNAVADPSQNGFSTGSITNNSIATTFLHTPEQFAWQIDLNDNMGAPGTHPYIRDVTISGNTTSDPLGILAIGHGRVARIVIDDNSSTASGGNIQVGNVPSGAVAGEVNAYVAVTNNSVPSGGTISFSSPSCFHSISGNRGLTVSDGTANENLPPAQLSVDQFLNRIRVFEAGAPYSAADALVTVPAFEAAMCRGASPLTPSQVVSLYAIFSDESYSNTSYAGRLATVNDLWIAGTGTTPPSWAIATFFAAADPGTASPSATALSLSNYLFSLHPSWSSEDVGVFIKALYHNGLGHDPSAAEDATARFQIALTSRQAYLAWFPGVSSGGVTVQQHLQPTSAVIVSYLLTVGRMPTNSEINFLVAANYPQDLIQTWLLGGPEYAALSPPAPTPGL